MDWNDIVVLSCVSRILVNLRGNVYVYLCFFFRGWLGFIFLFLEKEVRGGNER